MANEFAGERFFSVHKFFWWLVYSLMLIGVAATWAFVNVKFLGNDIVIGEPTYQSGKHK